MAIVGHNFYLDGVKQNDNPLPVDSSFTFDGLASSTVNPSGYLVAVTNVDGAGLESPVSSLTVLTAEATPPPPPPPVVETPLSAADAAAVDAIVAASMKESKQPGVIVAITGPKGYYAKGYGLTATSGGRPVTVDDHFRTASVAKTFTTTAFWMAVDKGLVTLDDVLEDFVPGVPEGDVIKMRNMLQMRSGVYEYTSGSAAQSIVSNPTQAWSEAKTLASIKSHPSQFPPGTKYAYANSNFALIGAVVEAVDPAHRTIRTIIQDDIFTPLGMTETKWPIKADGTGDPAIPNPAMSTNKFNPDILGPAGGYTSTVGDFIKWAKAMRDGTLISADSLNQWHSLSNFVGYPAGFPDPPPTKFGYGFGQESTGTWFGHNGSWIGFSTQCAFDSVSGACIAVAENKQTTSPIVLAAYTRIFRKIAKLLYPNSMAEQDYLGNTRQPIPAVLATIGGAPTVTVTAQGVVRPLAAALTVAGGAPTVALSSNKVVTPTGVVLRVIGGSPGGVGTFSPGGASLHITGSAPTVSVAAGFSAFNEENINRTNQTVPVGVTGAWVTAIGGGGGGGSGRRNTSGGACGGGGGGGGGAKIARTFIPVASLGSTYSTTRGLQGAGGTSPGTSQNGFAGAVGTATTFTSGPVSLSAGYGHGGAGGITIGGGGGAGGTASVAGVTATTTSNGTSGAAGSTAVTAASAADNTTGGAGGGGGGGGTNTSDVRHAGGAGGDSTGQTGGGGGAIANPGGSRVATAAGVAGGGGGGGGASSTVGNSHGGSAAGFGAGGGGGGGAQGTAGNVSTAGGDGGDGYLLVEWV